MEGEDLTGLREDEEGVVLFPHDVSFLPVCVGGGGACVVVAFLVLVVVFVSGGSVVAVFVFVIAFLLLLLLLRLVWLLLRLLLLLLLWLLFVLGLLLLFLSTISGGESGFFEPNAKYVFLAARWWRGESIDLGGVGLLESGEVAL